jgi:hypothetical protein
MLKMNLKLLPTGGGVAGAMEIQLSDKCSIVSIVHKTRMKVWFRSATNHVCLSISIFVLTRVKQLCWLVDSSSLRVSFDTILTSREFAL